MPKVVKLRRDADGYITAPLGAVRVDRATQWGNPFVMDGEATRDACCAKFEDYAEWRNGYETEWLTPLRGRDLACWCAPKRCHADTLLKLANAPAPRKKPERIFDGPEPKCKSKHKETFTEADNSCGGFFIHCWECGWCVDAGMMGHN